MRKYKVAAVIDIGSSVVRMHISQWDGDKITELDILEQPIQMGKEVFSMGFVSSDTAKSLTEILSGFCEKAREYDITSMQVIAATALREATNQAYILDHILTRTKLEVKVLEDSQVGMLLTGALRANDFAKQAGTLLVYGGTGTTDLELIGEETTLTHSLQTGLLKITEMLREASDLSKRTDNMALEYLNTFLTRSNRTKDLLKAKRIVFGTSDLQCLYRFLRSNGGNSKIEIIAAKMFSLYESLRSLSISQISLKYRLTTQQAENLYAMITLLTALLRATKAEELICVQVNLANATLDSILRPDAKKIREDLLHKGAITSAYDLAERYLCDIKHASYVSDAALSIFKVLKKTFGFTKLQGLLLNISCILHEAGHYANSDNAAESAYYLIRRAHIYGLRSYETLLAASFIVSPQNLSDMSLKTLRGGIFRRGGIFSKEGILSHEGILSYEDSLVAAKMFALARLADALDFSHLQKAKLANIELLDDILTISVHITEDYTLEQWVFNQRVPLFREIFGITPKLKLDNIYTN